jgi:hypothetical protein
VPAGSISFEELAEGLQAQGYMVDRNEVEHLMTKLDLDRDGNLVYNEFLATMIDWSQVCWGVEGGREGAGGAGGGGGGGCRTS